MSGFGTELWVQASVPEKKETEEKERKGLLIALVASEMTASFPTKGFGDTKHNTVNLRCGNWERERIPGAARNRKSAQTPSFVDA